MTHLRLNASLVLICSALCTSAVRAQDTIHQEGTTMTTFEGRFFSGDGDASYIELLDTCARVFWPDPELQNISMLYSPAWNGFVEGPTWGAWWVQNSYGPTYCALPFLTEPYTTFLRNSQDLWFSQMGDGQRKGAHDWVAPDGCLCDAAAPDWIVYKQGDGRLQIHDWGMEFTAAGLVMQAELLLISRDTEAIGHYLPLLRRCAEFIESRRDPVNNLFLAGAAGNLLAPSYAGYRRPDGTYDMAYLTGLSVTYIAALDRLIELEKLAGEPERARRYRQRRDLAKEGLAALTTEEGYLVKSMGPDGTKHGVYGADSYGYFEAVCNHDAVALRVVDDVRARQIYDKIASIPGLRPHDVIVTNYPSLDDMYTAPEGLWGFGTWVNGGHWTTCEARMILAYFRLGQYEDARRAMEHILKLYRTFRTDNPLVQFGAEVYQPREPINCVYDTWGAPAGMIRGLFEYLYTSDGVTVVPHIPSGITRLDQHFPVRLGDKRLYLSTRGQGEITGVWVNGESVEGFDGDGVLLTAESLPPVAQVTICLGGASPEPRPRAVAAEPPPVPPPGADFWDLGGYLAVTSGNLNPLRIGADSRGSTQFLGLMQRARVFERELTAQEVAALAVDPGADLAEGRAPLLDYRMGGLRDGVVPNAAQEAFAARVVGELTPEEAPGGRALRFSGKGYLQIDFDPRLNLAGPYTLDAWVCPGELPQSGGRIIDKVTAGVDDGYLLDMFPPGSFRLITERGHCHCAAGVEPGTWVHVAATYDPEGELRLYVGGELCSSLAAAQSSVAAPEPWEEVGLFAQRLRDAGMGASYEAAHARLVVDYVAAIRGRADLREAGRLTPLPPASQLAADKSYLDAANRLVQGLKRRVEAYEQSDDPAKQKVLELWRESVGE